MPIGGSLRVKWQSFCMVLLGIVPIWQPSKIMVKLVRIKSTHLYLCLVKICARFPASVFNFENLIFQNQLSDIYFSLKRYKYAHNLFFFKEYSEYVWIHLPTLFTNSKNNSQTRKISKRLCKRGGNCYLEPYHCMLQILFKLMWHYVTNSYLVS